VGGRRGTSSLGSRRVRSYALSRVVSSILPLSRCSRFWSTCRRFATSTIGSRGGRNCVLIGGRIRLMYLLGKRTRLQVCFDIPYSMPYFSISSAPSSEASHHGATEPRGGLPQKSVICLYVLSRMACCCSSDIRVGFSCE